jgi:glucose-1-phosphate thymidylyltransferase
MIDGLKVVIPAAGAGTRLRPHTHTTPKTLVRVAGKPILGHVLDSLSTLAIEELIVVVGYMGDKIREFITENYDLKVTFVEQPERLGLGYAISLTKEAVGDSPMFITLDDTIIEFDLHGMLENGYSAIGVKEVEDPRRFGVVELKDGFIRRLIEKPKDPPTNLAIVGVYFIRNSPLLFECLDELIRRDIRLNDEYQLTDGLQMMIERGERIRAFPIDGWFDCGKPETLLATNRHLLQKQGREYDVPGSIIIPPVFIGEGARIERSILGPYVSVAEGCLITDSIVSDSIINENARVEGMVLKGSLIGSNAVVKGKPSHLNVGDSSEVNLH